MNTNSYCTTCNKECGDLTKLRSHRTYMRGKEVEGHEIKESYSSKGSTLGCEIRDRLSFKNSASTVEKLNDIVKEFKSPIK
jgi:hypothetical protein